MEIFNSEKEAFQCLGTQKGIVQYLGAYSFDSRPAPPGESGSGKYRTYNILLEYGQFDLDEYFADKGSYPPVRATEIRLFWTSLFEVADALCRLHNHEHKNDKGDTDCNYNGYFAIIKSHQLVF